ncbi:MAG: TatD family hydrolase [Clostridia bacterium]|nr:TatD family hydrolase [Clostridia bacterium]
MIDTHAHLNDEDLIERVQEIIDDGYLEYIVVPGYDFESSKTALALAKRHKKVYCALGCHPHDAKNFSQEEFEYYLQNSKDEKVVAIGEIGLDYHYDLSPREVQKEVFKSQIDLAHNVGLPVVLHVRDAYKDTLDIMTEYKNKLTNGVLLHCYSGSAEMVREFSKFDAYFAFGGAVTYKNAKKEEVLRAVKKDRLLLETDCPYMTPVPFRGKQNEPKFIRHTAEYVASALNMTLDELDLLTTENAKRFFGTK